MTKSILLICESDMSFQLRLEERAEGVALELLG